MERNWARAIVGGIVGTLGMTAVGLWVAPIMGIPRMNPADMLARVMGGSLLGWMGHLMIGTVLALVRRRGTAPGWTAGGTRRPL
jgi:ABC-type uncharacterized transport system ATPase component